MPRKLPPYCEAWRDRHGRLRVYFRRGKGSRIPLPSTVGSAEFQIAYLAAMEGKKGTRRIEKDVIPRSVEALVRSYLSSAKFRSLRETTKKGYRPRLEYIRSTHGGRSVEGLNPVRIRRAFLEPLSDRPGQSLAILKLVRVLTRHAIELGWIHSDPTAGIKRPKTEEIRSWTEEEIARFEKRWPIGSKQRLAFSLMLYTGQRRSDVHRMTWADVAGEQITVTQLKTGVRLVIPLHFKLREVLAQAPRSQMVIVATAYGRPFSVNGFSQFLRDAIRAAGLPDDCQPHGLRKAAGRRLAEAGATSREIMAVLGHKTLAEAERYTRDADQMRLASAAVIKMENSFSGLPKPRSSGLGNGEKHK